MRQPGPKPSGPLGGTNLTVTPPPKAEAEGVDLVSALIRFYTSNTGESDTTKAEPERGRWLADNRPDLFDGVTEALGEVGGFSLPIPRRDGGERPLYLIETAEKAMMWMRLTARGRAGHGSMTNDNNAVTNVADAAAKMGR